MAETTELNPQNPEGAATQSAEAQTVAVPAGGVRTPGLESAPPEKASELEDLRARAQRAQELEQSLKDTGSQLEKARGELGEAVSRYKALVLTSHPHIPPELIGGASIPEIESSLEKAEAIVEKIRSSILQGGHRPTGAVPAGAPARSAPDWSGLSPREKIKAGITQRK